MRGRIAMTVLLLGSLLAFAGCDAPWLARPAAARHPSAPPAAPRPLTARRPDAVPNLRGRNLFVAQRLLRGSSLRIFVRFPAVEAHLVEPAYRIAGALHPARNVRLELPGLTLPLASVPIPRGPETHIIAAQSIPPGDPVSRATTLTLTVSTHPGQGKAPWVIDHAALIKRQGVDRCFQCHRETECSRCHIYFDHQAGVRSNTRIKLTRPGV